jgi:hypothetical protein
VYADDDDLTEDDDGMGTHEQHQQQQQKQSQPKQEQAQEQRPAKAPKAPTTPRYPRKMTIPSASPTPVVTDKLFERNQRPRKVQTQLADKIDNNM